MGESMKDFTTSLRYESWANQRLLERLRETPVVDLRATRILAHILAAQQIWLARMKGGETVRLEIWPDWELPECGDVLRELEEDFRSFAGTLTEERLQERVEYRDSRGTPQSSRIHDILRQVTRHGAYHRGQITIYLKRGGGAPVDTDYITWVRETEKQRVR